MAYVSTVSTVPAAKAWLVAAIAARPEITGSATPVAVTYGEPNTWLPNDIIAVTDATQVFTVAAMIGSGASRWLEETYTLDAVVDCFLGGDLAQVVEERALLLASVVVDVIRTDPSLGGLVIQARPTTMRSVGGWEEDHKGRRGQVFLGIEILSEL